MRKFLISTVSALILCAGIAQAQIVQPGGPPTGPAGGSLSGTYPNPGLAAGVGTPGGSSGNVQTNNGTGGFAGIATTGTGSAVLANSPVLVTPALGTVASGNVSAATSTSSSSTTARTLAARGADVINVKDFGAVGNDTTDDTAAIQAVFTYARTLQTANKSFKIVFPLGIYKITSTLNWSGIRALQGNVIDGGGSQIDCEVSAGLCIDMSGDSFVTLSDLTIYGFGGTNPTYGIQLVRVTPSADAIQNYFRNVTIQGDFTAGALLIGASETDEFDHLNAFTDATGGYSLIMDGSNHWNWTSAFQTITQPVDTAVTFNGTTFISSTFININPATTPIWISNAFITRFIDSYIDPGTASPACVTIYTTATTPTNDIDFDLHCDPNATNMFLLDSPAATAVSLFRLKVSEPNAQVTTSLFSTTANVASVNLVDAEMHVTEMTGGANTVFATPSLWTVSGYAGVPASKWNLPVGQFNGVLNQAGKTSVYAGMAGAASSPSLSLTGAPFTGGSGTTTVPLAYINLGTAPTTWSTAGTIFGINSPVSYGGNEIDIRQNGGSSIFSVNSGGTVSSANSFSAPNLNAGGIGLTFGAFDSIGSTVTNVMRLGATNSAAPSANTLTLSSVVAGTSNTAGQALTIAGSQGTGTGAGGAIILQTAPAGTTGTAQNAEVNAEVVDAVQHVTLGGGTPAVGTGAASIAANATDQRMKIVTGTAVTSISWTFGKTWINTPVCTVSEESATPVVLGISALTTAGGTITALSALTGITLDLICQ